MKTLVDYIIEAKKSSENNLFKEIAQALVDKANEGPYSFWADTDGFTGKYKRYRNDPVKFERVLVKDLTDVLVETGLDDIDPEDFTVDIESMFVGDGNGETDYGTNAEEEILGIVKYVFKKFNLPRKNEKEETINYKPKNKEELHQTIVNLLKKGKDNINLNNIDISNITDLSFLFEFNYKEKRILNKKNLEKVTVDISKWDVSHVTNMHGMFADVEFIFDISKWDVSNVTNMEWMFDRCVNFNSDLSNWDVSNVTNMKNMFAYCKKFNSDLSNWDVSNVTNMDSMFSSCYEFNSDLSKWNVSNVTTMDSMFEGCKKFNSDLSKWDVSNVKDMRDMFRWSNFNGDISSWDVSNVTNMSYMFYMSKFNKDLSKWNIEDVEKTYRMFDDCPIQQNPPKWYIQAKN